MFSCLFNKKNQVIDIKELEKINICKVCGKQFDLIKDNKYIVQENKGINGITTGTKKF